MESERQAFLKVLEKNRCDQVARGVFADWLDERGEHEEANEQRRMATDEWVTSARWLETFAAEGGRHCINYNEISSQIYQRYQRWSLGGRVGDPPDCDDLNEQYQYVPITFEMVVEAGRIYLDSYSLDGKRLEYFVQHGSEMLSGQYTEEFWHHWTIVTGRTPEWETEVGPQNPFSCSC